MRRSVARRWARVSSGVAVSSPPALADCPGWDGSGAPESAAPSCRPTSRSRSSKSSRLGSLRRLLRLLSLSAIIASCVEPVAAPACPQARGGKRRGVAGPGPGTARGSSPTGGDPTRSGKPGIHRPELAQGTASAETLGDPHTGASGARWRPVARHCWRPLLSRAGECGRDGPATQRVRWRCGAPSRCRAPPRPAPSHSVGYTLLHSS